MKKYAIGVDIGGSHITSLAVDPETREILHHTEARRNVDCHAPSEEILNNWVEAIHETMVLAGDLEFTGIGFAMPGPFDYPGGIAMFKGVEKYESLFGINIREEMEDRLFLKAGIPVRFMNDASCFAMGEAWMGEAANYNRVVAITLGTGYGSSFVNEGIPVETGPEVPPQGCLYHLPFGESNADSHFSTRWFLSEYKRLSGKNITGVKELVDMVDTEPVVRELFTQFGNNLATFMSEWLKLFKTECLVMGGNIAKSYDLFGPEFHKILTENGLKNLKVYISVLSETAAICGSARLTDDDFYSKLDITALK
jgi:glucokinase